MKDCNYKPAGTGFVQGDGKEMPDRGTSTGWNGADPQLGGMSTDQSATNSMGGMGSAANSDPDGTPFGGKSQTI